MIPFGKHSSAARPQPSEAQKAGNARVLKNGAYAAVLAAIVLAAVILINLVAGALPSQYTQFDISTGGLFTLSDTTRNLLHSLERDVTVYYLGENGSEDENITRLLDRYAGESSHFRWQQRDPVLYPTFAQQYGAENASAGSVIVTCGDHSAVVDYNEMYAMDYTAYYTTGSINYTFEAESALTGAISRVTSDSAYTLYQLTGHGETALDSGMTDTLANANVTVADLNLLAAGAVPQDAAAVVINAPQVDYTEDTVALLRDYLDGGGCLLVTTSLTYDAPNLDALLAGYGLTRQSGLLVEGDANYYAAAYAPTYLIPAMGINEVTAGVADGMMIFAPIAQGILTDAENEEMAYTTLLSTSDAAYAMQNYAEAAAPARGEDDPAGSFAVAVAAESAATGARIVWVGTPNLFLSEIDQMVSGGNAQLLGSIVNWFTGEENAVVIDGKSMSADYLTVPGGAVIGLGLLFVVVLPLACIVAGVVVVIVRRRR